MKKNKKLRHINKIDTCLNLTQSGISAFLLGSCMLLGQPLAAEIQDHTQGPGAGGGVINRPGGNFSTSNNEACQVNPEELANLSNGTNLDLGNLVNYLAVPSCERNAFKISQKAVRGGVNFNEKAPFRLDYYAKPLLNNDIEGWQRNAADLSTKVSSMFRASEKGTRETLPEVGQFSLLSPEAGRKALVQIIAANLLSSSDRLKSAGSNSPQVASQAASSIRKLGADRMLIAHEFGKYIEEAAVLAQADSLGRVFLSLGMLAKEDDALIPTFNLSAVALAKGIRKSASIYQDDERDSMIKIVFGTAKSASEGSEAFEPALESMNIAFLPLIDGKPIDQTALKKAWLQILTLVSETESQPVLAEAVAMSLTPDVLFLSDAERVALSQAAKQYWEISGALQGNFLIAWRRVRKRYERDQLSKERMRFLVKRYLKPWTEAILKTDQKQLDFVWLKTVVQARFIDSKTVERKFPVYLLTQLKKSEPEVGGRSIASTSSRAKANIQQLSNGLASLWTLSHVYVPALSNWVEDYEEQKE